MDVQDKQTQQLIDAAWQRASVTHSDQFWSLPMSPHGFGSKIPQNAIQEL